MAAYVVIALMTCGLVAVVMLGATLLIHHARDHSVRPVGLRADHMPQSTLPFDPRY